MSSAGRSAFSRDLATSTRLPDSSWPKSAIARASRFVAQLSGAVVLTSVVSRSVL